MSKTDALAPTQGKPLLDVLTFNCSASKNSGVKENGDLSKAGQDKKMKLLEDLRSIMSTDMATVVGCQELGEGVWQDVVSEDCARYGYQLVPCPEAGGGVCAIVSSEVEVVDAWHELLYDQSEGPSAKEGVAGHANHMDSGRRHRVFVGKLPLPQRLGNAPSKKRQLQDGCCVSCGSKAQAGGGKVGKSTTSDDVRQ